MPDVTTRAEFTEKVERLLDDAKKRFQQLELKQMRQGEVDARAKLANAQERFRERREELEKQLKRARKAGDNAWDEVKSGVDTAWNELAGAIDSAREEFDLDDEASEQGEEQRKLEV